MRKILLVTTLALEMGFAVVTLPAATHVAGGAPNAAATRTDTAGAYGLADVFQPGSRGTVVEV